DIFPKAISDIGISFCEKPYIERSCVYHVFIETHRLLRMKVFVPNC
ncbi:34129_t:CDS:1, partial [Racocetra persica]